MKPLKLVIQIFLLWIGLGACQNFLSPTDDSQYTKDRFYNDPAFAYGMLINAYTGGAFPTTWPMDEVATDDAVSNLPSNNYRRMATGEWSALFDPTSIWNGAYNSIMNMNYFLTIVDTVQWSWQDTIKNRLFRQRYTGEAIAFRGYYLFRLLQRNGGVASDGNLLGVPLPLKTITSTDDWKLKRPTFKETVDQINSDFDAALKLMPYRYRDVPNATSAYDLAWNKVNGAGINRNLLDGRAVLGVKARLALLAASPAYNNGNYDPVMADSAVQIAGRMIKNNGGFTASVYPDAVFWDADNDVSNDEIIWRNDYSSSRTLETDNFPPTLYGNGRVNPSQNFVDAFPMLNGYPIDNSASGYNPQNPYTNRDPRLKLIVVTNLSAVRTGSSINTAGDSPTNDGINKLQNASTRTGYYLLKLLRKDVNLNPSSTSNRNHFYVHQRWTEILLIYAEAANEKYGPTVDPGFGFTAKDVIAAIRKRAGISQTDGYLNSITDKAAMRELIRNERRLELSFEGFRFWDLRRWMVPLSKLNEPAKGVYITTTGSTKNYDYTSDGLGINPVENRLYQDYMYYAPIPYLDTKKYEGLLQNKGW